MSCFIPDWDIPSNVKAFSTDRISGFSKGAFNSFNLGAHVGDDLELVLRNRASLPTPTIPVWLKQVHGTRVLELPLAPDSDNRADATFTCAKNLVSVVMTADCLPVLICNKQGNFVAAVHCGWRSLAQGILEKLVDKHHGRACELLAWLGPAIGEKAFEVGEEVRIAFSEYPGALVAKSEGKYLANLKSIAADKLRQLGITDITICPDCTYLNADKYYSYRRDGQTGRMASLIWFE